MHKRCIENWTIKQYFLLWEGYQISEVSWIPEENFDDMSQLVKGLAEGPSEEEIQNSGMSLTRWGVVVGIFATYSKFS